jgi:hypothetical protein
MIPAQHIDIIFYRCRGYHGSLHHRTNYFRTFHGGIMQTNLLPAQPNEEMESLSPQDVGKPPESVPVAAKKRSKLIIAWIGLGLCAVLFLLSFAWVGYWAYTLNTQLTATQHQ